MDHITRTCMNIWTCSTMNTTQFYVVVDWLVRSNDTEWTGSHIWMTQFIQQEESHKDANIYLN